MSLPSADTVDREDHLTHHELPGVSFWLPHTQAAEALLGSLRMDKGADA